MGKISKGKEKDSMPLIMFMGLFAEWIDRDGLIWASMLETLLSEKDLYLSIQETSMKFEG